MLIIVVRQSTQLRWCILLTQIKLQNDNDDMRTMFSTFGQHSLNGPIELDTLLVRSFHNIHESLIFMAYEEIRACYE